MADKRETYIEQGEAQAKRHLQPLARRWPTDPKIILGLLIVTVVILLLLWL